MNGAIFEGNQELIASSNQILDGKGGGWEMMLAKPIETVLDQQIYCLEGNSTNTPHSF